MLFIIPINYTTEEQRVSKNKVPGEGRPESLKIRPVFVTLYGQEELRIIIRSIVNRLDVDLSNLENLCS